MAELNLQVPPTGFGSYLDGILPDDQATAAGAFAMAMGQVKNINAVDLQTFAQVVFSTETLTGLSSINGTTIPTDATLANAGLAKIALGTGPYGTYTLSDFFGCMSGLPYPLQQIYNGITELQTTKLLNIYNQLFLAVKWEGAVLTPVATQVSPGVWQLTGMTITDPGGGYGRGTAPVPTITLNNGAAATCIIGTDSSDPTTYGKITGITITNPGTSGSNNFTASVQCPPTATLAVTVDGIIATGGTNTASGTAGWPGMNTVVQAYIDQANAEILAISTARPQSATILNANWNITGTALKVEQRSRYIAISPVSIPYSSRITQYPMAIVSFVDAMSSLAQDTVPHGGAQVLESISDTCTTGGQSTIGLLRQERNQVRLQQAGITLDNNIPDTLDPTIEKLLITNGTIPGATEGVPAPVGNYTLPAWSKLATCDGTSLSPEPVAYYDPNLPGLRTVGEVFADPSCETPTVSSQTILGNINSILQVTYAGPYDNGTGPPVGNISIPVVIASTNVPLGGGVPLGYGTGGIQVPIAESVLAPPANVLPATLDTAYTSSTLSPSTFSTKDAVDAVIDGNCDCWVN